MMIEAMAEAGPGTGFGPGTVNTGGCEFNSSLGQNAFGRIAGKNIDKAVKAMAFDAATARSETIGEPIGMYKLKVKKAEYVDKSSGNIMEGLTLISPDFNDEPIAVWTDAGEHGNGTKDEYQKIISRANQLAQTERSASMFWVSPGEETDGIITPHRAYLWVKKDDDVTAYSYSLSGNADSLSEMMGNLGYHPDIERESLENQTLIRRGENNQISHTDVFQAFVSSLSQDELNSSQPFIQYFKHEVDIPDNVRERKLASYKEQYEKELRETYKNDIKQALESIALGFVVLPEVIDEISNIDSNAVSTIGNSNLRYNDKLTTVELPNQEQPNQKIPSQPSTESERNDVRPTLAFLIYGFINLPDITDDENKGGQLSELTETEKQFTQLVIQPLIPIFVVLPALLQNMIEVSGDSGNDEIQLNISPQDLTPVPVPIKSGRYGILPPIPEEKPRTSVRKDSLSEESLGLKTTIQDIIEGITDYIEDTDEIGHLYDPVNQVPEIPKVVEDTTIKSVLHLSNKLSMLLSFYTDKSQEEEMKQFVAIVMYQEIQKFQLEVCRDNPVFMKLLQRIDRLPDDAIPAAVGLNLLVEGLKQVSENRAKDSSVFQQNPDDLAKYIFIILYILSTMKHTGSVQRDIGQIDLLKILESFGREYKEMVLPKIPQNKYSIEKLYTGNINKGLRVYNKKILKKKSMRFPRTAVIFYCFSHSRQFRTIELLRN